MPSRRALKRNSAALGIGEAYWERPFSSLSGGEQTRCLLASLFVPSSSSGPDAGTFALIDEPTNHLDREGRRFLADYLRAKAGFLLVSHDRAFLDACCDHVVALNRDTVEVERTSFSAWRERFRQRLARQRADNAALKQEITRLGQVATDRRAGALKRESEKGAHVDKGFISARAKRQMRKAVSAERRAESAAEERRAHSGGRRGRTGAWPCRIPAARSGRWSSRTTSAFGVAKSAVFEKVSFTVAPGDRVAVVGPNGCGKTSLLDQIEGAPYRHTGTLRKPGHVTVARTFQHPEWTSGLLRERLQDAGIEESRFRQVMAVLGVRGRRAGRTHRGLKPRAAEEDRPGAVVSRKRRPPALGRTPELHRHRCA